MMKRVLLILIILFATVLLAGKIFVNECDDYSGWDLNPKYCYCNGYELVLYDDSAVDGDRRSVCIGVKENFDCFKYVGGIKARCD